MNTINRQHHHHSAPCSVAQPSHPFHAHPTWYLCKLFRSLDEGITLIGLGGVFGFWEGWKAGTCWNNTPLCFPSNGTWVRMRGASVFNVSLSRCNNHVPLSLERTSVSSWISPYLPQFESPKEEDSRVSVLREKKLYIHIYYEILFRVDAKFVAIHQVWWAEGSPLGHFVVCNCGQSGGFWT